MKQIKFLAILASVFLYVGCGDGDTPTKVVETAIDKVAIYTNADAIAYKSADASTWTTIVKSSGSDVGKGVKKYEIDKMDKFNVALRCNTSPSEPVSNGESQKITPAVALNKLVLFAYTKDDGDVYYKCQKYHLRRDINGTISYNVNGDTPDKYVVAAHRKHTDVSDENYSLQINKDKVDLVSVALMEETPAGVSNFTPLRFYIEKAVPTPVDTIRNITFNSDNSCTLTEHNVTKSTADAFIKFISENGTELVVNQYTKWYSVNSTCPSINNKDTYVEVSMSEHGTKLVSTPATSAQSDVDLNASHIKELTGIMHDGSGTINGLNQYIPDANSPSVVAYKIDAYNHSGEEYVAMLTKNYLGSESSYTLENLKAVAGFENSMSGDEIYGGEATAIMSNKPLNEISGGKRIDLCEGDIYAPYEGTVEYARESNINPPD